jgi:hypothetical protein
VKAPLRRMRPLNSGERLRRTGAPPTPSTSIGAVDQVSGVRDVVRAGGGKALGNGRAGQKSAWVHGKSVESMYQPL